ncbi:hypothetical protein RvY_09446 [Ramazzottius varieornatus]|uniref:Small ribosomal subunit protein bS16m n=1 Tax=Ramazzottius varieornatus TaxID=947166 RepID=A0A1D1V9C8_RAMVA|nr:hypothetical protein RvY_09446 [Ramazzottius varieornatus]
MAVFAPPGKPIIRLLRAGCTNRPFYHVVVQPHNKDVYDETMTLEQVGTYDPMPNANNEKLVAFNFDRIRYWLGSGASTSKAVDQLFGICGFFPVHPMSYITAQRNRKSIAARAEAAAKEAENKAASESAEEKQS